LKIGQTLGLARYLMVSHHTLKQLFSAKLFLGGFAQRFNPDSTPYLQGRRHQIYILDLIQSNFRIRKLLSFIETAVRRRANVLFVLRKGWIFGPSLTPFTSFVQYYTGGILSNFSAVLRHYKSNSIAHYVPEFPGIVCFFTEYSTRSVQALNEARHTRTPCTYLFDSGMHPHPANYGVTGSLEFGSALFLSQLILTSVKRGKRKEQFLFAKIIRLHIKKVLHKQGITKLSPEKMKSSLMHKSTFFKPWKRRIAFSRYDKKKPNLAKFSKALQEKEKHTLSDRTTPLNGQEHHIQWQPNFSETFRHKVFPLNVISLKTKLRFKGKTKKRVNNSYSKQFGFKASAVLKATILCVNEPESIKINSTFGYFDVKAALRQKRK
jgi:hypothetical protein